MASPLVVKQLAVASTDVASLLVQGNEIAAAVSKWRPGHESDEARRTRQRAVAHADLGMCHEKHSQMYRT